jgi:hypothetical protein
MVVKMVVGRSYLDQLLSAGREESDPTSAREQRHRAAGSFWSALHRAMGPRELTDLARGKWNSCIFDEELRVAS